MKFLKSSQRHNKKASSRDEEVTFQGNTFSKGPINRGTISYNPDIEVSQVDIRAAFSDDPFIKYLSQNPIDPVWIEIIRVHDSLPNVGSIVFIGQISKVGFKGQDIQATSVSFEFFLRMQIPTARYQPKCNHFIYDDIIDGFGCGVDKTSYKVTATATVSGFVFTSSSFGNFEDGYFKHGWIEYGDEKRMISNHFGNDITIRYAFAESIPSVVEIDVYPGCDGGIVTCRDKFSNKDQFGGHIWIPVDNPATRF